MAVTKWLPFEGKTVERRQISSAQCRRLSLEKLEDRSLLATFSVVNLNDSGAGSLRQAIENANSIPGADSIDFEVAGTIQLTSAALPDITGPVNVNGSTAPGFTGSPRVEIDANGFAGIKFDRGSGGSFLASVGVVGAANAGVTLQAAHITLVGNYIGLKLDGMTGDGNGGDGVRIAGHSFGNTIGVNLLGGNAAAQRNVIAANHGNGIAIQSSAFNRIVSNYIGTDAAGTSELGNEKNGILMTGKDARFNRIGGTEPLPCPPPDGLECTGKPPEGNVVSGNEGNGVLITNRASFNTLSGNFIGTDLSGNQDVGNRLDGVAILNDSHHNSLRGARFTLPAPIGGEDEFTFYNEMLSTESIFPPPVATMSSKPASCLETVTTALRSRGTLVV